MTVLTGRGKHSPANIIVLVSCIKNTSKVTERSKSPQAMSSALYLDL